VELSVDFESSAQKNAGEYYKTAQKLEKKLAGLEKAMAALEDRYDGIERTIVAEKKKLVVRKEQKWYEKFNWFYTSEGFLVIGGRDAHQNELVNSRYFNEGDLFFHADIHGGSVTVLVEGEKAHKASKEEAAQFAGCHSSAWQSMLKGVDVYSLRRGQISKSTEKGSLGTGSFLMKGEREWYRSVKLELIAFVQDEMLNVVPSSTFGEKKGETNHVTIAQGEMKKSDAAKSVSKRLGFGELDLIMRMLPSGTFMVR
jgi:predicted ribosome quality control (RQC) complex YloA/Tae2 family protein